MADSLTCSVSAARIRHRRAFSSKRTRIVGCSSIGAAGTNDVSCLGWDDGALDSVRLREPGDVAECGEVELLPLARCVKPVNVDGGELLMDSASCWYGSVWLGSAAISPVSEAAAGRTLLQLQRRELARDGRNGHCGRRGAARLRHGRRARRCSESAVESATRGLSEAGRAV